MKKAIIVHGMPSKEEYEKSGGKMTHKHWQPWLTRELAQAAVEVHNPEMPMPYQPDYKTWKAKFEQYSVDSDTMLVRHSCGGGFLVRWLSENKDKKAGK